MCVCQWSDNYNRLTPLGSQTGRPHRTAVSQPCVGVEWVRHTLTHTSVCTLHSHIATESEIVSPWTCFLSFSSKPPKTVQPAPAIRKLSLRYANLKLLSLDHKGVQWLCVCLCLGGGGSQSHLINFWDSCLSLPEVLHLSHGLVALLQPQLFKCYKNFIDLGNVGWTVFPDLWNPQSAGLK